MAGCGCSGLGFKVLGFTVLPPLLVLTEGFSVVAGAGVVITCGTPAGISTDYESPYIHNRLNAERLEVSIYPLIMDGYVSATPPPDPRNQTQM